MSATAMDGIRIHVHAPGDRGLDGILRLIETSSRDVPLEERLGAMCRSLAQIADVDVVSVYVRERAPGKDRLVMRGNVGFPEAAVAKAKLELGEGITGFVAECQRPVSTAVAASDSHFKPIPGLGEERFPSFLGVPVVHGGRSIGVLVLQRRSNDAFTAEEVVLATALAAPFAAAIEDAQRRGLADGGRAVRLRGTPVVTGAAMGRLTVFPTLAGLREPLGASAPPAETVLAGVKRLERDLRRARIALSGARDPAVGRALSNLDLALSDARFRSRLGDEVSSLGLLAGLTRVAREYARVPYVIAGGRGELDSLLEERAREVEDLCVLVHGRANDQSLLQQGTVLATQRLGAFAAIAAVATRVSAVVVEEPVAPDAAAAIIMGAAGIPLVCGVTGVFGWARTGDLSVINAHSGTVDINPSAADVARFRSDR